MHRIRLSGPWDYVRDSVRGTVKSPFAWSDVMDLDQPSNLVTIERKFHRPTNLDSNERVFVVAQGITSGGIALLNDESLGDFQCDCDPEFEVTQRLARFNCLQFRLQSTQVVDPKTLVFVEVALEIRTS